MFHVTSGPGYQNPDYPFANDRQVQLVAAVERDFFPQAALVTQVLEARPFSLTPGTAVAGIALFLFVRWLNS
jgi:hypothetical protein